MNKNVFKRYELKYILTPSQYEIVLEEVKKHLHIDSYGETTIQSLYYDTPSYRLIRNSIESPEYKEKMRIRSYGLATSESTVFLELKKKFQKVVPRSGIEPVSPALAGGFLSTAPPGRFPRNHFNHYYYFHSE